MTIANRQTTANTQSAGAANAQTGIARILLARHATPDWNRHDIPYDIPPGPPLTATGEREALALGAFMHTQGIVRVYHSPLERTKRTAQLAVSVCGAELIESYAIAEWRHDEAEDAMLARVLTLYEKAAHESLAIGPIAIVTHGGPVLSTLGHLGAASAEINHYRSQFDHRNPLPPAGAWLGTRHNEAQAWNLRLVFAPNPIQPFLPDMAFV
jgi:broad specificity phosphatase PhoE